MDVLRDKLTEKVSELPENYLDELAEFIDFLFWKHETQDSPANVSQPYQVENDPLIGLFAGPPDLAEQAEFILEQDTKEYSGWTWKTSLE